MKQPIANPIRTPWVYQITNGLLALLFAYDLTALGRLHHKAALAAKSTILATDPNKLLAAIRHNDPSWWLWAITILSLLISVGLLVGWWLPQLSKWKPLYKRISLVWLLIWVIYFVIIIVRAVVAINQFLG